MGKRIWMTGRCCGFWRRRAGRHRKLQFVETDVILYPNGQASVKYTVRYKVLSGSFTASISAASAG